ncbi:hypothetical protein MP228_007092 [Amoeboaphelidium protococcarum]|nr:hypothetical protein MP228_007092 [Amoeboaphelidium protococcarum]
MGVSELERVVVIDGKDHLVGRLASVVAKQLLNGQRVVVVRCEQLNVSGPFFRNKLKYKAYLRKRCVVNPRHGQYHFRAPSRMFYKVVRGMIQHKLSRGKAALNRLKVYEGVPPPYDKVKRVVVPDALRVLRLKPGRKFTVLGDLSTEFGWKYGEVVSTLEAKRKVKSAAYFEKKNSKRELVAQAKKNLADKLKPIQETMEGYGYTL